MVDDGTHNRPKGYLQRIIVDEYMQDAGSAGLIDNPRNQSRWKLYNTLAHTYQVV